MRPQTRAWLTFALLVAIALALVAAFGRLHP
jgi:hypothetical protein